jgi:exodeoxyribonuclease V beta subunit
VYVPFAWDRYERDDDTVLKFHTDSGDRVLHVGGTGSYGYDTGLARYLAENRGETLRLLYVALTRARSQVIVWWARTSRNTAKGPLTRVLLGTAERGQELPPSITIRSDAAVADAFTALAARSPETIGVESVSARPQPVRWSPPRPAHPDISVASFTRQLDTTWGRASYTRLTAGAHEASHTAGSGLFSEPATTGVSDEPETPSIHGQATIALPSAALDPARPPESLTPTQFAQTLICPLSDLPGGASFGTLVHTILETIDTSAYAATPPGERPAAIAALRQQVLAGCRLAGADRMRGVNAADLADGLVAVLTTPLGPTAPGVTLAEIGGRDRLSELEFELPLAGGDTASIGSTIADIGGLLLEHLDPGDVFYPYAERLRTAPFAGSRLRGYLTGSLDSVLRLTTPAGTPRYVVVDYKTNRLGPRDQPVTAWDYRPQALTDAMSEADYVLQMLLYLVALHRYLRWRQPGYDPDEHLGGGLYLFVRGMCGPSTPILDGTPTGALAWRPPTALVVALSALVDGTPTRRHGVGR